MRLVTRESVLDLRWTHEMKTKTSMYGDRDMHLASTEVSLSVSHLEKEKKYFHINIT